MEFSSISNYLAAVVSLHVSHDLSPTDLTDPLVRSAMEGARRQKREFPQRKAGITPQLLRDIFAQLSVLPPTHRVAFWAACLTAFYSLLRSANLFSSPGGDKFKTNLRVKDARFE